MCQIDLFQFHLGGYPLDQTAIVRDTVEIIAVIAKPQAAEWLAREGILITL